jgi:hypothetical protein
LHNLIADPANRKITAYKKLKKIKQSDKQIVRNLRSAIELFKQNIKSRSQKKKTYTLFTALRPSLKREILRELRDIIAFREKIVNVIKRYEEQATAKKVAAAPAKNTKPINKGSNHESQTQGSGKSKNKNKEKRDKQKKREKNAFSNKNKDLFNIKCYNCYKRGHYVNTYTEPDTREKDKNKQSKKLKKD